MLSQWKLQRNRRRQTHRALQLLTVAGTVRPADIVIHYRGAERSLGTWSSEKSSLRSEVGADHRSIWNTDVKELWNIYRQGTAA